MTNRLHGDKGDRGAGHRNVPIRKTVKRVTPGKAMVTLSDVVAKLQRLAQDGSLDRWERACYQTAVALVEKAVDELRR